MTTLFRPYNPATDKAAAQRIWREVGWMEDKKKQKQAFNMLMQVSYALVAEVNGEAECITISTPGEIRYLAETLPFDAVTGVTTSRIARKQGLAGKLTGRLVAAGAAEGALVTGLGIFEQGYYDQMGFGSGNYEHWLSFDPTQLQIDREHRVPRRLKPEDWKAVHASRLTRHHGHGAVDLLPPEVSRSEMLWTQNAFGLGYFDDSSGELTHHLWLSGADKEHGPYEVRWYSYRTMEQFLELLALLKSLGDQVRLVWMREPRGIQLQDFLKQPFRFRQLTKKSKYEQRMAATAYWQLRMNDIPACLAHTHLHGETLHFNLSLSDPIESYLPATSSWQGVTGEYIIKLGVESQAERGHNPALPTLTASVNAFTRLWLGTRPATGLAVTADLAGPPELLTQLDWALRLPCPKTDWDF